MDGRNALDGNDIDGSGYLAAKTLYGRGVRRAGDKDAVGACLEIQISSPDAFIQPGGWFADALQVNVSPGVYDYRDALRIGSLSCCTNTGRMSLGVQHGPLWITSCVFEVQAYCARFDDGADCCGGGLLRYSIAALHISSYRNRYGSNDAAYCGSHFFTTNSLAIRVTEREGNAGTRGSYSLNASLFQDSCARRVPCIG